MFKLVLLNGIGSKFSNIGNEKFSKSRTWYTDGYETPGINKCNEVTQCEANEICQNGVCVPLPTQFIPTAHIYNGQLPFIYNL